jgi:hypothetical protein
LRDKVPGVFREKQRLVLLAWDIPGIDPFDLELVSKKANAVHGRCIFWEEIIIMVGIVGGGEGVPRARKC